MAQIRVNVAAGCPAEFTNNSVSVVCWRSQKAGNFDDCNSCLAKKRNLKKSPAVGRPSGALRCSTGLWLLNSQDPLRGRLLEPIYRATPEPAAQHGGAQVK
ncbi:MAG: hypothetical protein WCA64_09860 [Gallionella sp.]